jgi:hypothetical protein
MLESLDFLPQEFNPFLRGFIYFLIIIHILAFFTWCFLAFPSLFKKQESFSDQVEKMIQKNREKHL